MEYAKYLPSHIVLVNDKVVRKIANTINHEVIEFVEGLARHFIASSDSMVVPIYNFEYSFKKDAYGYEAYHYTYEMARLGKLSEIEQSVIDTVGDGHSVGITKPCALGRNAACQKHLDEAWEHYPKIMDFLGQVIEQRRYVDLHGGNIMVDENGDYKLIDIEGFMKYPLIGAHNEWIPYVHEKLHAAQTITVPLYERLPSANDVQLEGQL